MARVMATPTGRPISELRALHLSAAAKYQHISARQYATLQQDRDYMGNPLGQMISRAEYVEAHRYANRLKLHHLAAALRLK